ncbi:CoA-binding domain protein [freshwater metagenome]|uniref:CoA-binding domain protein n=1 Tax=freshwater metagenome TaxID=449393 RepID=A0A094QCA6_9ZZZZ
MNNAEIKSILEAASSVAVIGVSSNPERASHQVAAYLIEQTHLDVYLVNPTVNDEILGQRVYKSLAELPIIPDIIDVFRKNEDMPAVFENEFPAIADSATGKTWWMQLGIVNDEVAKLASDAGMKVVMDRCIKVDYMNLVPEGK